MNLHSRVWLAEQPEAEGCLDSRVLELAWNDHSAGQTSGKSRRGRTPINERRKAKTPLDSSCSICFFLSLMRVSSLEQISLTFRRLGFRPDSWLIIHSRFPILLTLLCMMEISSAFVPYFSEKWNVISYVTAFKPTRWKIWQEKWIIYIHFTSVVIMLKLFYIPYSNNRTLFVTANPLCPVPSRARLDSIKSITLPNMRYFLLSIILLFFCSPSSLGFTADIYYIETLIADSTIFLDTHNFSAFAGIYTKNLFFGAPSLGLPTLNSSEQLIAQAYKLFPKPSIVLQNAITTQRITLVGPTDESYEFTKAKAITYLTTTFFGSGNLTGQIAAIYSRLDDTLVKSCVPGYGGWKVGARILSAFVSSHLIYSPPI